MSWLAALGLVLGLASTRQDPVPPPEKIQGDKPPAPVQDPVPAPTPTPAPSPAPPAPDPAPATSEPATPVVPSFAALPRDARGRVDEQAFLSAVEALLRAHPQRIERLPIGKSGQGREILLFAVGDRAGVERERRPAFFATLDPRSPFAKSASGAGLASSAPPASLIFLDWIHELCARPNEAWGRFLRENVLYLIVLPEPDRALHGAADELGADPAVDLAHDFPHGWDPRAGPASGQGAFPLSRAETRALAGFLQRRTNIACALLLAREGERPAPSAPEEGGLGAGGNVRKLGEHEIADLPASLERFAARELLLPVLLLEIPRAGELAQHDPASRLASLAGALPHLEAGQARVERLSNTTWLVDLPLKNSGFFATGGEGGRPGAKARSLALRVAGARWISAAQKSGERTDFEELPLRVPPLFLDALGGGEECTLRVLLEAEENASPTLEFESQRAGSVRVVVPLVSAAVGAK